MGWGSKLKNTVSKGTKIVKHTAKKTKTVQKAVQKVANTPIVKTTVTVVATAYAGKAGAQAVDKGYSVLNSENPLDFALGPVSSVYSKSKGYYNQLKGKSSSSSILRPASSNVIGNFSDKTISYAGTDKGLLQIANGIDNTVKSAQGKKKGLIAEILSWFGF